MGECEDPELLRAIVGEIEARSPASLDLSGSARGGVPGRDAQAPLVACERSFICLKYNDNGFPF